MNEAKHDHEHHEGHSHHTRWKRVHHSWIFWVAVFLMMLAIITYVMTGDLFWGHQRVSAFSFLFACSARLFLTSSFLVLLLFSACTCSPAG